MGNSKSDNIEFRKKIEQHQVKMNMNIYIYIYIYYTNLYVKKKTKLLLNHDTL